MKPRSASLLLPSVLLLLSVAAHAATVSFSFENQTPPDYSTLSGKNAEGSQLSISREKAHDGNRSLKLDYQTAGGYIQFTPRNVQPADFTGDKLYIALWVYGAGRRDFASASVRLLDKNNETFQYTVPGFAEAMGGDGWREVRATIDLTKPDGSWGDRSDKILDRPFSWFGFAAGRSSDNQATGTVYLDDLRISDQPIPDVPAAAPVAAAGPATLTLTPVTAPVTGPASRFLQWVVPPGQPVTFNANLTLGTPAQGQFILWKVRDAFDNVLAEGRQPVPDGATQTALELRVPKAPRGVLYATASLRSARDEVLTQTEARAVAFTPRQKPVPLNENFVYAVAAHVARNQGQEAENEIALMRIIGFPSARADMGWNTIQPERGVWNWTIHDRIYADFQREGVMPVPVMGYGTRWATTGDPNAKDWHQWANTPPVTADFVNFAREAVKRYGHLTHYWEIWNEPDIDFWLGTPEQYVALVDAVVPAIKEVQPNAQIMNGGFSETKRRPDFIPTYFKLVKNRPDILAIHSHMQFENMLRAEEAFKGYLKDAGLTGAKQPKIWMNEAGYSSWRGAPERIQAEQLVKKMAYAPAAGFSDYTWYDLRNDGTDDNEIEHHWGLVTNDYRPKASLVAANTLLETLGTRTYSGRLPLQSNAYALTYRGNGGTALVAWQQIQQNTNSALPLMLRATSATGPVQLERVDLFGNRAPIEAPNGSFFLTIDGTPQYVVASRDDVQFQVLGKMLDFPPSVVLTSGETLRWPVKVFNPLAQPLTGTLTTAGSAPINISVPANTTQTVEVPLRHDGKPGSREPLTLTLTSTQLPVPLKASAEMQLAYQIPADQPLSVTLPRSNIVSLFEATPMQELHFKDAADLSATAQFQKTPAGILARFIISDQTHVNNEGPNAWWRGDSIQWAIALPDSTLYEWTAALLPTGAQNVLSLNPNGPTGTPVPTTIRREGGQTIYEWLLPNKLPNGQPLPNRFTFDFIVNDNDGAGRKGWIEWTPGIGMEKNPAAYMPLAVE